MLNDKIKVFFKISGGNSGLTEEFIYSNQPTSTETAVKVYTGASQTKNTIKEIDKEAILSKNGKIKKIKWYNGIGIKIVRKGKAGSLILIQDNKYTINDDAYILQIRPKYKNDINIKYMLYTQIKSIKNCVSSSGEGKNGTFNKTLYEERFIILPDKKEQDKIVAEYERYTQIKNILEENLDSLEKILKHQLISVKGEEKELSDVFIVNQGHQITDEELYNAEGTIPVYTADNSIKGYWNKSIISENELPCLTYATKAFAGKITIHNKLFDANNTAVLLTKEDYINKIDLRYFKYILPSIFIKIATSKGGVSYLNKELVEKIKFIVPSKSLQKSIADEYGKLENIKTQLEEIKIKLEKILD